MLTVGENIKQKIANVKKWQEANPALSWYNPEYSNDEGKIYITKDLLESAAYRSLTRVAMLLYQDFLSKRIMKQISKKSGCVKIMGESFFLLVRHWKSGIQAISSATVLMSYKARDSLT